MPVVHTYNQKIIGCNSNNKVNYDTSEIISDITFGILQESPKLVADVAAGLVDREVLEKSIVEYLDRKKYSFGNDRNQFIKNVIDYMYGYGPLQELIEDEDVSDIDGTAYNEFTITKKGIRQEVNINFGSEKAFEKYCKLLIRRNDGIINENDSQCRVTDRAKRLRINVSIRPRNESGPALSIRKHRLKSYTFDDLLAEGMFNEEIKHFLIKSAKAPLNIVVCGKGGSGKTTLTRAIINNMPELDRVLICERESELYPDKKNCIEQKIKKENIGGNPVTLRDLVRDGLTMSLDCYVIGESVSSEAGEGVRAAHTGHRFLTTTHVTSAYGCLPRLLTLCQMDNVNESEKTLKEMIGNCIDLIIYMKKFKVAEIVEVLGYDNQTDKFLYNPLYKFVTSGIDAYGRLEGNFIKCGDVKNRVKEKLQEAV